MDHPVTDHLKEIMKQYNCGLAKARYIWGKEKKGLPYHPHEKHYTAILYEDIKDVNVMQYTWCKGTKEYSGMYIYVIINDKQVKYPVAAIIYCQYHKCDKPDGYVINHIDGNPLNNSIENLECIPASDNTSKIAKDPLHFRNQYTKHMTDEEYAAYKQMKIDAKHEKDDDKYTRELLKHLLQSYKTKLKELIAEEKELKAKRADSHDDIDTWRNLGDQLKQIKVKKAEIKKNIKEFPQKV